MIFEERFSVRLCEASDAPTLAPLVHALAVEEGYAQPPELEQLGAVIDALLVSGFSDFLLAERQGAPVGCLQINYRLSTWATAPYAYIEDLYLVPEARAIGIGTSMIDYACQRAAGRGCAYVELDVRPENRAAQLYARMGFRRNTSELWRRPLPTEADCAPQNDDTATAPLNTV